MMECVFHGKIKNMGLIKFTIGCVVAAVLGVICEAQKKFCNAQLFAWSTVFNVVQSDCQRRATAQTKRQILNRNIEKGLN
jgi:hypothetical protein